MDKIGNLPGVDLRAGIWDSTGLRSGHVLAVGAVTILLIIYSILGILFCPILWNPDHQPAALFYLLFLLTLLTWVLSGAAFFLDKLRLPVFTSILAFSLLTGAAGTDHEFSIKPGSRKNQQDLSPDGLVTAWAAGPRKNQDVLTIVSTAGGGIRAAAWTTEVLTGLQEHCGAKFSSSVLLISSVSGGSVGSMQFLSAYDPQTGALSDESLDSIRTGSSRSSLSAVGWGFLYPDFLRTVPFLGAVVPQSVDRGWALENAWVSGARAFPDLSGWRKDAADGSRPAAIFNATAAESGERFVIASTDADDPGTVSFNARFANWDIPIATAARLSATFPYVSAMARASSGPRDNRFHVADGGYYDNSGVLSAVAWLRRAASEATKKILNYKILLVVIDSEPSPEHAGKMWSWQRQISAPVETLKNVRTSSQEFRDDLELKIAVDSLRLQNLKVDVARFIFRRLPPGKGEMQTGGQRALWSRALGIDVDAPPLSWHLNQAQRDSISRGWRGDPLLGAGKKTVYDTLECTAVR